MKLFLMTLLTSSMMASPAIAQLVITQEQADLETSAGSACPEDLPPEPDTDKYFVAHVVDADTTLLSAMNSACGDAATSASLSVTRTGSTLSGTFATSSALDTHGGGSALLGAGLLFEVQQPVTYSLSATGTTVETGDPDIGSMEFFVRGGSVDHSTNGAENFDLSWSGTFQPGVTYALYLGSASERSTRALGGGTFLFMDGDTTRSASFTLTTDREIVPLEDTSWSSIKSRY